MDELFDDDTPDAPGTNAPALSVSELSGAVKRAIEGGFSRVRVRGEVGRTMRARSGHLYFDLKDDRAVLGSVAWKGTAARLDVQPEEGMEVIATGRMTTFPGQSRYQLVVESLAPAGVGALMAMLEKRRKALAAEGLFDDARKRPIPYLPKVIGVVTSPSGAVIRDILHRLRDRFPREVYVWPVAVQGKGSAEQVAAAIRGFDALPTTGGAVPRPDLLIVARGGGSVEDLWGFNEEIVVRAAADCSIPLISAVGHETDTTLIDFAADRRAPTPTAAAEMAVPVRAELAAGLAALESRRVQGMARTLARTRDRLAGAARLLPRPEGLTEGPRQRLDYAAGNLPRALQTQATRHRAALDRLGDAIKPARLKDRLVRDRQALTALSLTRALSLRTGRARDKLSAVRLSPAPLARSLRENRQRLAPLTGKLTALGERSLPERRRALAALSRTLETLSPNRVLDRGYAIVRSGKEVITRAAGATDAAELTIQFADGTVDVSAADAPPTKPKKQTAKPKGKPKPEQGSLF